MGLFDGFRAHDAVEKQGVFLFEKAMPVGRKMCQWDGSIGRISGAVVVGSEKAEMIVIASLMHCAMYRFMLDYLDRNPNASRTNYQKFCYAACNAGCDAYGQDFALVMQSGQEYLYSDDAQNRIMIDASNQLGLLMSITVECVSWCFQMLNGGRQTDIMTRDQMSFIVVTHEFDVFATTMKREVHL